MKDLRKICQWVQLHQVYLSAGYATSLFKKETGMSIMDYIIKVVLTQRKMLQNHNSRVSEVSYKVGYENMHISVRFLRIWLE